MSLNKDGRGRERRQGLLVRSVCEIRFQQLPLPQPVYAQLLCHRVHYGRDRDTRGRQ